MTNSQVSRPSRCYLSLRMFRSLVLPALIAFNAVGCGEDSQINRKPVFGNIVGAEGRNGTVTFIPIDTSIGPAAIGTFENGAYKFSKEDGPVPGEYNVSIEFQVTASSAPARQAGRRGRFDKGGADTRGLAYEPAKTTTASVSADGPFEIDLDPN